MTLAVWVKDGYTVEVIKRLHGRFTEQTGIEVDLHVASESAAHDEFASGAVRPDVTTVPYWYLPEYASKDWLRPLDDLLDELHARPDAYASAALDAMRYERRLYAMPHTLIGGMLSYRADLLEAASVEPPTTDAAILSAASSLAESAPAVAGLVVRDEPDFPSFGTYAGWAWGRGVRLLPREGPVDPGLAAEAIRDLVCALVSYGAHPPAARDYVRAGELMCEGRTALFFDTSAWGHYLEDPARSRVAGRVGYLVPRGPRHPLQFFYSEGLAVTSWSRKPAESLAFIRWRHSPATLRSEVEELGRFDFPQPALSQEDWYSAAARRRGLVRYLEAVAGAWAAIEPEYFPRRPDFVPVGRALMRAIGRALRQDCELEPALTAALGPTPQAGPAR